MQLPQEFRNLAEASIGKEAFACFCAQFEATKGNGVTSIRVNTHKAPCTAYGKIPALLGQFGQTEPVLWCSNGYYLSARPTFTLDPLFHCGAYYVQEASSMYMELAAAAIEQNWKNSLPDSSVISDTNCHNLSFFGNALNALDLCAAPGGKSTHLLSLLSQHSILVSNEVIKSRATILADNIAKWGTDNAVVTNNDPADFGAFESHFHLIVVDAPCSGEGLFIKEPEAINEWSLANVNLCAQRQQRILADIWHALKPGGYLIYSTCTYNKYENDGNLAFLEEELGAEIVEIPLPHNQGPVNENESSLQTNCNILRTPKGGIQFVPGMVQGEGQFMAVVKKPLENEEFNAENFFEKIDIYENVEKESKGKDRGKEFKKGTKQNFLKAKGNKKTNETVQIIKDCNYLNSGKYILTLNGDLVKGYRKELYQRIKFIESNLRCILSGAAVANQKGKDYIPHSDLALQDSILEMLSQKSLPAGISAVEVGKDDALRFLAKEPLVLKNAPLGYILLTYQGMGLGFLKNIGNRTNNLLPMARRIRMDIH